MNNDYKNRSFDKTRYLIYICTKFDSFCLENDPRNTNIEMNQVFANIYLQDIFTVLSQMLKWIGGAV